MKKMKNKTVNQKLAEEAIRHRLFLSRYSTGEANRLAAFLQRINASLAERIITALDKIPAGTTWGLKQDAVIRAAINKLSTQVHKAIYDDLEASAKKLMSQEVEYQVRMLRAVIPAQVQAVAEVAAVNASQAWSAAIAEPFQGALLSQWAGNQSASFVGMVTNTIRSGYILGETTDQILRRVRGGVNSVGVMARAQNDVSAVVKSAISHFAAEAREQTAQANEDIIKAREWLSTLDTKTSATCIIRDKKQYTLDKEPQPIGHKIPYGAGPGKIHFCCRSTETWVVKSWRELGIDADEMPEGVRASMDGEVPGDTTYATWVKNQPARVLRQVFGTERGQAIADGKLTVPELFTDKGEYISLERLKELDAQAFAN